MRIIRNWWWLVSVFSLNSKQRQIVHTRTHTRTVCIALINDVISILEFIVVLWKFCTNCELKLFIVCIILVLNISTMLVWLVFTQYHFHFLNNNTHKQLEIPTKIKIIRIQMTFIQQSPLSNRMCMLCGVSDAGCGGMSSFFNCFNEIYCIICVSCRTQHPTFRESLSKLLLLTWSV